MKYHTNFYFFYASNNKDAAAVAVVAAAAAAGERARVGKPQSEIHHPAGWSARPSFLLPRPPPPPPTGAIRRHPPSLPPHPQVRGVSSGSGDPKEPSRVTICSATWQELEEGMIFSGVFLR